MNLADYMDAVMAGYRAAQGVEDDRMYEQEERDWENGAERRYREREERRALGLDRDPEQPDMEAAGKDVTGAC